MTILINFGFVFAEYLLGLGYLKRHLELPDIPLSPFLFTPMKRISLFQTVRRAVFLALLVLGITSQVFAQTEGDYLYKVTLLRAAPGHFNELMTTLESSFDKAVESGDEAPFWMRHSQGDHWDFMVIYPMDSWQSYFAADRVAKRATAWNEEDGIAITRDLEQHLSYSEDWYSFSVDLTEMTSRFDQMGLFHIEMFAGLPGQREELLEQRRMENRYYAHLDRQQNIIFTRAGGSNWDAMTIGTYTSLAAFAAGGTLHSAQEQEEAARVAGFSGTEQIGPYLRSLLSYHNDTMAVSPR